MSDTNKNKLEQIEQLLGDIKTKNPNGFEAEFETINDCVMSYIRYHNEAVDQGRLIAFAKFRLEDDKFAEYIENLHERRKAMHKDMIDKTIVLNAIFKSHNMPVIYDGKLNTEKGRDDDDTRFGVAEFAERFCHDCFRTTHEIMVSDKSKTAFREHAENVAKNSGSWNMMQRMMEKMEAQSKMDSSQYEP